MTKTDLRPTQHHAVKEDLQLLERNVPWSPHPILLNRTQDLVVPKTDMPHWTMTTI